MPATPPEGRRVVIIGRDLLTVTRIADAAAAAGYQAQRIDGPDQLPSAGEVHVALVDWSERQPGWAGALRSWRDDHATTAEPARVLLFGPHTDIEAHMAARDSGLGPMMARSKLFASLPALLRE